MVTVRPHSCQFETWRKKPAFKLQGVLFLLSHVFNLRLIIFFRYKVLRSGAWHPRGGLPSDAFSPPTTLTRFLDRALRRLLCSSTCGGTRNTNRDLVPAIDGNRGGILGSTISFSENCLTPRPQMLSSGTWPCVTMQCHGFESSPQACRASAGKPGPRARRSTGACARPFRRACARRACAWRCNRLHPLICDAPDLDEFAQLRIKTGLIDIRLGVLQPPDRRPGLLWRYQVAVA